MDTVCNSCGSPETTRLCEFCLKTPLCGHCYPNHAMVCEPMQKKKKLGLGPTVRQDRIFPGAVISAEPRDVDQGLAGIASLLSEK